MPDFPKITNPFEDETDFIDETPPAELAKQAAQQAAKVVNKQVVKPTQQQLQADQAIVDFLYGASDAAPNTDAANPANAAAGGADAGIEHVAQGGQTDPQQMAKLQQIADPDQQMAKTDRAQLTEEQYEQREKHRLHIRNYFTVQNKLDDIGQLEEQIAKVRQMKQQEEEERKREEEEEEERKRQEEEEQKQQLAPPSGKKTGVPEHVKREQNKAENKTGFSG